MDYTKMAFALEVALCSEGYGCWDTCVTCQMSTDETSWCVNGYDLDSQLLKDIVSGVDGPNDRYCVRCLLTPCGDEVADKQIPDIYSELTYYATETQREQERLKRKAANEAKHSKPNYSCPKCQAPCDAHEVSGHYIKTLDGSKMGWSCEACNLTNMVHTHGSA